MIATDFQRYVFVGALALALVFCVSCVEDPGERIGSIYDLKATPSDENLRKIRGLLQDEDRDVRATALNALVSLQVEDAEELARNGLDDSDGFVRSIAAKLIGDVANPANVEILAARMLVDRDPVVRQRCAEAMMALGGDQALQGLVAALDDPQKTVRLAAVKGVRKLDRGVAGVELSRLILEDSMWEIRAQAATALGGYCGQEVRPVLDAALEDPNEFVRAAASNAIKRLSKCETSATGKAAGPVPGDVAPTPG